MDALSETEGGRKLHQIGKSNLGGLAMVSKHALHSLGNKIVVPIIGGEVGCTDESGINALKESQQKILDIIAMGLLLNGLGIFREVFVLVVLVSYRDSGGIVAHFFAALRADTDRYSRFCFLTFHTLMCDAYSSVGPIGGNQKGHGQAITCQMVGDKQKLHIRFHLYDKAIQQ